MNRVSLVIPSWDGVNLLNRTLPSVLQQVGLEYEVIVVDNGSPNNDTPELVRQLNSRYPNRIRIITIELPAGFAGAVNAGVRSAKNRMIAVLGNDNEIPNNWLSSLMEEWGTGTYSPNGKQIGAVMTQTIVSGNLPSGPCTLNLCGRNVYYEDDEWTKSAFQTFYPGGNSFLFDKDVIGEPFTDMYFVYHEDVSLGWRIQNLGMVVVQLSTPHVHSFDGGTTQRDSVRHQTYVRTERNRWINLLTFPSIFTQLKLSPLWLLDSILALLFGQNRLAKIGAWIWILINLKGIYRLRTKHQLERRVSDREALTTMSSLLVSECPKNFGLIGKCKSLLNFVIKVYALCLRLPFGKDIRHN